jgi:dCMP deaminase
MRGITAVESWLRVRLLSAKQRRWHSYYLAMAATAATKSKDPYKQVGCALFGPDHETLTTGYNGLCRGVKDDPTLLADRDSKLLGIVHAEENAVATAARHGIPLKGSIAAVTKHPCTRCASQLVQVGIVAIVCPSPLIGERSVPNNLEAMRILRRAGILTYYYDM